MEQSSTSPATYNVIRGAGQSGNIAKQRLLGRVKILEADMAIGRLEEQVIGSAA